MSALNDYHPVARSHDRVSVTPGHFDAMCAEIDRLRPVNDRFDAARRDLMACRSELASIAILLQERGHLPDPGGINYALVAGAVTEYVLSMELAVIALNEDRKDLLNSVQLAREVAIDHRVEIRGLRAQLETTRAAVAAHFNTVDDCDAGEVQS